MSMGIVGCTGQPTSSLPTSSSPSLSVPEPLDPQSYYTDYWQCVGLPTSKGMEKRDSVNACLIERGYPPIP